MLTIFRWVALLEGISYLLLLFVAMPLKYFADFHEAVTVAGWAHGGLFVLYLLGVLFIWMDQRWSLWKAFVVGIASIIPFAPFFVDRKIKKEQEFDSKTAIS